MVSIEDFLPDFGRYLLFVSFLFYVESSPGLVLELRVHLLHHHCWPITIMICPEISGVFDMVCPCLPIIQNSWPKQKCRPIAFLATLMFAQLPRST